MRIKTVKQYHCDFCKKKNYSAGHMKRHELHCTLNPDRKCGMCKFLGQYQRDLQTLISLLPEPVILEKKEDYFPSLSLINIDGINKAIKEVYSISGECPTCTLAAIRQKKIPLFDDVVKEFNYKQIVKEIFDNHNATEAEERCYY